MISEKALMVGRNGISRIAGVQALVAAVPWGHRLKAMHPPMQRPTFLKFIALMAGLLAGLFVGVCYAYALPVGASRSESVQDSAKLTTVLPTQTIRVARPFELRLQVNSSDPARVELADGSKDSFGVFEIIRMRSVGPVPVLSGQSDAANRFQTTLILVLETARSGQRNLPAFNVRVTAGEDGVVLVSDAAEVAVEGVVPGDFDPTKFRDLKPLAEIEAADDPTGNGFWLLIPIAILMGVMFFFRRRLKSSDAAIRQRWIAEIDSLENDLNNRAVTLPTAHDETCAQIRQWIQTSLGIPATSLPTDPLIDELRSRSWSEPLLERLSKMLRRNDRLKFAADADLPEQLSGVFDDARWLIRHGVTVDTVEANP